MKKLLLIASFAVILAGCGAIPQKFDNNEYEMLVRFAVTVEELNEQCDDANAIRMALPLIRKESRIIELYAENTPRNNEVHQVAKILAADIKQLTVHYGLKLHNKTYCKRKTDFIVKKAKTMLKAIPKKKR